MYFVKKARFKVIHAINPRNYASNFIYDNIEICNTKDGKTKGYTYEQLHQLYLSNPDLEIAGLFYDDVNDVLTFAEVTPDDWETYRALYTTPIMETDMRPEISIALGGYLVISPFNLITSAIQCTIKYWYNNNRIEGHNTELITDKETYTNYFKFRRGALIICDDIIFKVEMLPTSIVCLDIQRQHWHSEHANSVSVDIQMITEHSVVLSRGGCCSFCSDDKTLEDLVDVLKIDYAGKCKGIPNTYEFYAKGVLKESIVFDTDFCLDTVVDEEDYSYIPELLDTIKYDGNTYALIKHEDYRKHKALRIYRNLTSNRMYFQDTSYGEHFLNTHSYEVGISDDTYYCRQCDGVLYFGDPHYDFIQTITFRDDRHAYVTKYLRYKKNINDDGTIDILDTLTGEVSPYNYFNGDNLKHIYEELGISCLHDFDIDLYRASIEADTKKLASQVLKMKLSGSIKNQNAKVWLVRKTDTLPATDIKFKFHVGKSKKDGLRFSIKDGKEWVDCTHIVSTALTGNFGTLDWYHNRNMSMLNYLSLMVDKGRVVLGIANFNINAGTVVFFPLETLFQGIADTFYTSEMQVLDSDTFLEDL